MRLCSTESGTLSEMGIFLLLLLVPFSFSMIQKFGFFWSGSD